MIKNFNLNLKMIWMNMIIFSTIMLYYLILKLNNMYWMIGDIFISTLYSFNKFSMILILLTLWMLIIVILLNNNNEINFMLMNLSILLMLTFISKNLLMFFFFFEFCLIPIFILLKKWGNYMNRIEASYYMLLYTLFFSFPLLFMLLNMLKYMYSLEYFLMQMYYNMIKLNMFEFSFMILAMMVKMPMFLMHFWLPKAHVEAPVFGSMYLASILLKLGSFGLIRLMNLINFNDKNLFFSISMIGMLIISLNCLRIIDMKIIVAYSSVIHMNMMITSMFTFNYFSSIGIYMMMLAHGLISSSMFFMLNEFYKNSKSRLFKFNKGLLNLIPSNQMLWFLICISNLGAPMSLNFISEIFMLISIISYSFTFMILLLLFIIIMLNSFYNLYLFMYMSHNLKFNNKIIFNNKINSMFIILMHWMPINFMFLKLNMFYII